MKILITGASGYLGQHFLKGLIERATTDYGSSDVRIYALYGSQEAFKDNVISSMMTNSDSNNNDEPNVLMSINVDKVDLKDRESIHSYIQTNGPFDLCFHLAAMSSPKICQQNVKVAKETNVPIQLFNELKHTAIVALSTDQVYCGTKPPYAEKSIASPVNVYGGSKIEMENLLTEDKDRTKPFVCLRSSIILGALAPYGGAHDTFLHFCQSRKGIETTFFTDEVRSVIAVSDVVRIMIHFCDKVVQDKTFTSGIYNMGGPERVSRMDMAIAVAKQCGFSHDIFLPAEKSKLNLGVDDVPSPLDISMDSTKLEEYVGWKFRGLEATIKETFSCVD